MRLITAAALTALCFTLLTSFVTPSMAGRRDHVRAYEDGGIVTAYSRHGNGAIDGAVRRARYGWEVQLPGGAWVGCRRSCEETLRVQTVDYLEGNGNLVGYGTLQTECGIFGCLELNW